MKNSLMLSSRRSALLGGLTALYLILFGLTGIVCCVAADARGLTREMLRFAPPADTGLPEDVYPELGRHLSDYLTEKKDSFQFTLEDEEGDLHLLFHENELAHMEDCRRLLALDRWVCVGAALLSLAGLFLLAALTPSCRFFFARGGFWSLRCFGLLAAGLIIWALMNYDGFFITFHRLAFRNDLWLLDPGTDLLIRLMPETLFMDLGLRGAVVAGIWGLLVTLGFLRLEQKNLLAV